MYERGNQFIIVNPGKYHFQFVCNQLQPRVGLLRIERDITLVKEIALVASRTLSRKKLNITFMTSLFHQYTNNMQHNFN